MGTKKLDTVARRAQIVAAAVEILGRQGTEGFSMAAIARRVGLVPSALYRHFKGKDEVLDAIVPYVHERLMENVAVARAVSEDPFARLEYLIENHLRLIREQRGLSRLVFSGEIFAGHPERRRRFLGMLSSYLDQVRGIVTEGQASGRIRADLDPDTAAFLYIGVVQPSAFLWHLTDGAFDVTREARRAWAEIRGILKSGKRE